MPINPPRTPRHINGPVLKFLYVVGFLFYLSSYLPLYINSSFLGQFVSDKTTGLIYTLGSAVSIAIFAAIPWLIRKVGILKIASVFGLLHLISLFFLAFGNNTYYLIVAFAGGLICS
jgi:hypothetical protein